VITVTAGQTSLDATLLVQSEQPVKLLSLSAFGIERSLVMRPLGPTRTLVDLHAVVPEGVAQGDRSIRIRTSSRDVPELTVALVQVPSGQPAQ
jgi:hypothetical protein